MILFSLPNAQCGCCKWYIPELSNPKLLFCRPVLSGLWKASFRQLMPSPAVQHPDRPQRDFSADPVFPHPQPVRVCQELCVSYRRGLWALHVPLWPHQTDHHQVRLLSFSFSSICKLHTLVSANFSGWVLFHCTVLSKWKYLWTQVQFSHPLVFWNLRTHTFLFWCVCIAPLLIFIYPLSSILGAC